MSHNEATELSQLLPKSGKAVSIQDGSLSYSAGTSFRSIRESLRHSISSIVDKHIGQIGYLGSMAIAVNSLTGPAMLNIPATYQRAGLIPTTLTVVFVCILSAVCSLHLANTISKVPGNGNYKKEIEYSEVFRSFWGQKAFVYSQIAFYCCITCLNVSSIVDTAQVVDTFLGHWFPGGSGAINLKFKGEKPTIEWIHWDYSSCPEEVLDAGDCNPFSDESGLIFSIGYMVILCVFFPMALCDLKENAAGQIVGFLVLLLTSCIFVSIFTLGDGLHIDDVSLWGHKWDTLFGVVLFNFAVVIAVPAWLYEKEPHVDVPTVIHASSFLSAVLYITIGTLGAMTLPDVSDNMLESMMSGVLGNTMQVTASVFAFFIIGLGTPLFSVLARQNLVGSELCTEFQGNIFAVFLPFSVSWLFYQGDAITQLLSWGGIIFTSLVAFILPLLISYHALDAAPEQEGSIKVYGKSGVFSIDTQRRLLQLFLVIAFISIAAAIAGNVIN